MTSSRPCSRAARAPIRTLLLAGALALLAGGCSVLPQPPAHAAIYDFGPPAAQAPAAQAQRLPAIALAEVQTLGLPEDSTALLYRLAYANAQQLRPYAQARWSQPPATLLTAALQEQLGQQRPVLLGDAGLTQQLAGGGLPAVLRVQLEEFSQVFDTPQTSAALVRVRATLSRASGQGEALQGQRLFTARVPADTPDAAGGARALTQASRQVATELAQWLQSQPAH
ncbi:ABC-type transport auxiliary lipoprotein family protein [Comamonas faecalis]|uniref:ABC-type transport auxiliary lipoprotein family protein n=1 Tax=Comamonas faecalis TaxID=1387849 RepID=A0ABP7RL69_9BURK